MSGRTAGLLYIAAHARLPRRFLLAGAAMARQPVKIGMSMPQTGSLGAGGQAALLAVRMWVEDVNAKGGLLGRKVKFIVYDDRPIRRSPRIYTKLLDVDKVDLIIAAPYGTVPTAAIMPLWRSSAACCLRQFLPGEPHGEARHVVQQFAMERRLELVRRLLQGRRESRRQDHRFSPPTRSCKTSPTGRAARQEGRTEDRVRPELSAGDGGFSAMIRAVPRAKPDMVSSCPIRTTPSRSCAR